MPVVPEHNRSRVQTEVGGTTASIDQIVMLAEQLLDATCKWKDEHDEKAEEVKKTVGLTDRLRRVEEALKKTRAE